MNLDGVLQTFLAEADELLVNMEAALLRVCEGQGDNETLNEIFRAAHTIKGSAGLFGLTAIVGFTHVVENVLDRVRSGEVALNTALQDILLQCRDHMALLVNEVAQGNETTQELQQQGNGLLAQLVLWADPDSVSKTLASTSAETENQGPGCWHLSLRFGPDVLRNGMDPMSFLRYLSNLGEITQLVTLDDNLPEAADFDPETLYLGFEVDIVTDVDRATLEDVFAFVQEDSDIRILPPDSKIEEYMALIDSLPESNRRLGEILIQSGALTEAELERALDKQNTLTAEQKPPQMLGEILTTHQTVAPAVVEAALDKQKKAPERRAAMEARTIRVDAEKLDHLINLIGELVISRQRVDLLAAQTGNGPLWEAVTTLGGFTENIRDAALTLRMVQIGDCFQRFRRVVRDTAQELGKSINLVISGAETELDRSMVEKLTDPLTHIVRNAIDHGIEPVDVRLDRGKTESGTLRLEAHHEAGNIVIEIGDDGGGLDIERIRAKAVANGVIDASLQLHEHELQQLIFHPGLSTADKVTDLSGRGVGMDVVKRNIEALQGGIDIESTLGVGTTFRIRLPLTLAIIDGFNVAACNTQFIIPQTTVLECMDLASLPLEKARQCVNLRGDQVPFIRLSDIFALTGRDIDHHEREKLVVVQFGDDRAGIVVEELYGEVQTVVKPLSPIFQALKGIGGSSLLGSGEIAFILDIPQLIELAIAREARNAGAARATREQAS